MSTTSTIKRGAVTLGCAMGLMASMMVQAEEKVAQTDQKVNVSEVQTAAKADCTKTAGVKKSCKTKTTMAVSAATLKKLEQAKLTWTRKIGHAAHVQSFTESDFRVLDLDSSLQFASGPELP